MRTIVQILIAWALIGYFCSGLMPTVESKKGAIKQMIILGPFYWVGVALYGVKYFLSNSGK